MYERLVANSRLAVPDDPCSCWLWQGTIRRGYPAVTVRPGPGRAPISRAAHRMMLEEVLESTFPFDEGGHLCHNPKCVNLMHLEVQTSAMNLSERRGYSDVVDGCWIPVLYPRLDPQREAAERAWDTPGILHEVGEPIPF